MWIVSTRRLPDLSKESAGGRRGADEKPVPLRAEATGSCLAPVYLRGDRDRDRRRRAVVGLGVFVVLSRWCLARLFRRERANVRRLGAAPRGGDDERRISSFAHETVPGERLRRRSRPREVPRSGVVVSPALNTR